MLTPLHRAVIAGYEKLVARLIAEKADISSKDDMGFTPLELAQLLDSKGCQKVLGCRAPESIKLQKKGENAPTEVPLADFEDYFEITYCAYPFVPSYEQLKALISNCPHILRYPWLAKESYAAAKLYKQQLAEGWTAPVYIKWIDPTLEYGLFADADFPQGTYIGEYTGVIRRLYRKNPDHNDYCMQYPTRWWSFNYYVIDALNEGNVLRFANHSDQPNMQPLCVVDRGLLRMVLVTCKPVAKGEQLTFDYGADFWLKRAKQKSIIP